MKNLAGFLCAGLIALSVGIDCSSSKKTELPEIPIVPFTIEYFNKEQEREPILEDIYGAHNLAFPDTSKYKMMGWTTSLLYSNLSEHSMIAETLFDADYDNEVDLIVFYHLKHFTDIEEKRIDSSKAPPMIIKLDEYYGPSRYIYNKMTKKYFRIPEIIRINRDAIRKT
ncbi:MAG: hypothetical protein WD876_00020 [Candidatus Pacearchaeota archaeon]